MLDFQPPGPKSSGEWIPEFLRFPRRLGTLIAASPMTTSVGLVSAKCKWGLNLDPIRLAKPVVGPIL